MKRILLVLCGFGVLISAGAFAYLQVRSVRMLEQVGIPAEDIRQAVFSSFISQYFSYPNIAKVKSIATGQRSAAVQEIYAFAKSYVQTPEFKKRYAEWREQMKPEPPEKPKSMAEQRKEQKAQQQASIKEMEQQMKTMPAEYQATMKETISLMKQQMKEYDNPDNPMFSKEMEQMQLEMYNSSVEDHKQQLVEWEKKCPADPNVMIRKWLNKFLDISKDVDFSARLIPGEGGKMVFAKSEFESKSSEWKMCYRAGREVVNAARAASQQWLQELR